MPLRSRVPLALVVLSLVLAAAARAAGWEPARILDDRDPAAAAAFLADDPGQKQLSARDADLFRRVFVSATDLKSVSDLLRGKADETALREGLRARPNCEFCQQPRALEDWAGRRVDPFDADHRKALAFALFDWDSLPSGLRDRLSSSGRDSGSWASLTLPERSAAVDPWLTEQLAQLMKEVPRTSAEYKDYMSRAGQVLDMLDQDRSGALDDRMSAVDTSMKGLADLQRRVAGSSDPAMRENLRQALAAPDLDTRLALMSKMFDGLGVRDAGVKVNAPPRPGQVFDDSSRRAVADLLRSGLFKEIAGTWAGDDLNAFYADHELKLSITHEPAHVVGSYGRGEMRFSEEYIVKFLKLKGRDVRDLQTDPKLLENLTADVAALFVHEATHQEQEAWRAENKLPNVSGQNDEIEAKQTEALFTLEKTVRDPAFAAFIQEDAQTAGPARAAAREADSLRDLGPAGFRDKVRALNYPDLPSMEGDVHERAAKALGMRRLVLAELQRRQSLPADEAAALENGPAEVGRIRTFDDARREFAVVGTPTLRKLADVSSGSIDRNADAYKSFRDRQSRDEAKTDSRYAQIVNGALPSRSRDREVPSPVP